MPETVDLIHDTSIDDDDVAINETAEAGFLQVATATLSRRSALRGLMATTALAGLATTLPRAGATAAENPSSFTFSRLASEIKDSHQVAEGYDATVLIKWGDKVLGDAPAFDVAGQSAAAQAKQFGYNCDYVGYMSLPAGSDNSDHGLLCVSHEYTNPELMFDAGLTKKTQDQTTEAQSRIEMAAHGHSVIEIKRDGGAWRVVEGSPFARRIHAGTAIKISGPAAGHARLKTKADPSGSKVFGTLNNCAGGKTPWGTVLIAEENIHKYFGGRLPDGHGETANFNRFGLKGKSSYGWHKYEARFDMGQEPNEANRFGWMVEFDPYDPDAAPVKRTSLGRFKHEGATTALLDDGRVVVYSGDDQRGEYLYKFITNGHVDPNDRAANGDLLDDGTLFVAKFNADKTLTWLPLVWGAGPLTPANGFNSQGDVLIETRKAADLMGATPMDRPEDVEPNPLNGRVYMMLTNNKNRGTDKGDPVDAVNPRAKNPYGHIVEMIPPGAEGDGKNTGVRHDALTFRWEFFLLAGNPDDPSHQAVYNGMTLTHGNWLAAPDNMAFDPQGRLWISTDQGSKQKKNNIPDGMYAADVAGPGRALPMLFFACPRDAEMCGPEFTPNGETLFVAVQHPGEGSTFADPTTRWPDFKDGLPPRPSIVAITKTSGGPIS